MPGFGAPASTRRALVAALVVVVCVAVAVAVVGLGRAGGGEDRPAYEVGKHTYLEVSGAGDSTVGWLLRPGDPQVRRGTIVMIHGGGWLKGATAEYTRPAAELLVARGFVVWNINYRRVGDGGGWPTTFTDVAAAVDHLADLGRTFPQIDTSRVTVVGHSAGGQLAAWTAGRATLPDGAPGARPVVVPHAVVSLAGVLDMRLSLTKNDHVLKVLGGTPEQVPDRYRLVDPLERINSQVPVVAVTGTDDTVVPPREAAEFVTALRARGGVGAMIEIPATGHGEVVDVRNLWWPTVESTIATIAEHGPRSVAATAP